MSLYSFLFQAKYSLSGKDLNENNISKKLDSEKNLLKLFLPEESSI